MLWKAVLVVCLSVGAFAELGQLGVGTDQLREYLRQQCANGGAADKANDVEVAGRNFVDCMKGLFDVNTIQREIEEAKPKGALDEVFGKYCAKTPELKTCLNTLLDAVKPCLEETHRNYIGTAKEEANQLIDFVCHKDGDRIALFIAEHGPECLNEKKDGVRACFEKAKETVSTLEDFKKLGTADKCRKYDDLSSCIVKSLEECESPTTGNMAESLFKYLRKSSPCDKALPN